MLDSIPLDKVEVKAFVAPAMMALGRESEAKQVREELVEESRVRNVSPSISFWGYLSAGDAEAAFDCLNADIEERGWSKNFIRMPDPALEPLWSDTRWDEVIAHLTQVETQAALG